MQSSAVDEILWHGMAWQKKFSFEERESGSVISNTSSFIILSS